MCVVSSGLCPVQILFSLDAPNPYPSPVSSKPQATTDDDISRDDVYTKTWLFFKQKAKSKCYTRTFH